MWLNFGDDVQGRRTLESSPMRNSLVVHFLLLLCIRCFKIPLRLTTSHTRIWSDNYGDQTRHNPIRHDTCKVLISGVVGTDAKEMYMKNGHYVVNFALAVVGHFEAIHPQEHFKPAEPMWISVEIWDELAKAHFTGFRKGHVVRSVGYWILNNWIDKLTGEERKMYKLRITKIMSNDEFAAVTALLEDSTGQRQQSALGLAESGDSGFSHDIPPEADQTQSHTHTSGRHFEVKTPRPRPYRPLAGSYTYPGSPNYPNSNSNSRSSDGTAGQTSEDGSNIWNLLENAKDGDYLPWWE